VRPPELPYDTSENDGLKPLLESPECTWVPKRASSPLESDPQSCTFTLKAIQYVLPFCTFGGNSNSERFEPEVVGSFGPSWKAKTFEFGFHGSSTLPRRSVSPFGRVL